MLMNSGRRRTWGSKPEAGTATSLSSSSSAPPLVFIDVWGFQRLVGMGGDNERAPAVWGEFLFLRLTTSRDTNQRTGSLSWLPRPCNTTPHATMTRCKRQAREDSDGQRSSTAGGFSTYQIFSDYEG